MSSELRECRLKEILSVELSILATVTAYFLEFDLIFTYNRKAIKTRKYKESNCPWVNKLTFKMRIHLVWEFHLFPKKINIKSLHSSIKTFYDPNYVSVVGNWKCINIHRDFCSFVQFTYNLNQRWKTDIRKWNGFDSKSN